MSQSAIGHTFHKSDPCQSPTAATAAARAPPILGASRHHSPVQSDHCTGLTWPYSSLQPLRLEGSSNAWRLQSQVVQTSSTGATVDESGLSKPGDGLHVRELRLRSPVALTVMIVFLLDSRSFFDS
ncbi:hypothetical protein PPTG_18882 [Phytophthora nicotianae INRA-310]|uniref:Uncharacterized protein n=1 Tax=Phytophthora nicotianae (strain INRA-310) TaxID=761204 RepID=W2PHZ0_PHYN3|nr:hypothetical protein PPTG_18882 [Phytophthora nicotianae INRA-310]ETM99639.1 hypothetical protein PPTG_18882 [Phytophthora nicotianae INRA-310]